MRATRWTWTLEDAEGQQVQGTDEVFATRADAEVWIGENWRLLREQGADSALLDADDQRVGAPLSLRPAD